MKGEGSKKTHHQVAREDKNMIYPWGKGEVNDRKKKEERRKNEHKRY